MLNILIYLLRFVIYESLAGTNPALYTAIEQRNEQLTAARPLQLDYG